MTHKILEDILCAAPEYPLLRQWSFAFALPRRSTDDLTHAHSQVLSAHLAARFCGSLILFESLPATQHGIAGINIIPLGHLGEKGFESPPRQEFDQVRDALLTANDPSLRKVADLPLTQSSPLGHLVGQIGMLDGKIVHGGYIREPYGDRLAGQEKTSSGSLAG